MYRAYIFPINLPIEKENINQATPVSIDTDYRILRQAANHKRLRCIYVHCLERLNPVRRETASSEVGHFAHHPMKGELHFCPYRAIFGRGKTPSKPSPAYRHNIRKIIESVLYHELLRKFSGQHDIHISISDSHDREPRIQIDGLARPLVIRSIAPHDEKLWREPFDGTLEGRQVLFFISHIDVPALAAKEINQRLLARCSTIVVCLSTSDKEQDDTFTIVDEIPAGQSAQASAVPLNQLDLCYANYQKLFGLHREPEYLFINTSQKGPIDYAEKQLDSTADLLRRKVLQLLAKRLLVESTGIQQIAFQQPLSEARLFFRACATFPGKAQLIDFQGVQQLLTDAEIHGRFQEQPTLQSLYGEFFLQAVEAMRGSIRSLEEENRSLVQQLQTQRKANEKSITNLRTERDDLKLILAAKELKYNNEKKQLEDLESKIVQADRSRDALNKELSKKNEALEEEQKRLKKLEKALEKLKNVPLSRLIFKHYNIEADLVASLNRSLPEEKIKTEASTK